MLALLLLAACHAPRDSGSSPPDTEAPGTVLAPRVLILDQELRHLTAWVDVIDAFTAAGLEVEYRRFYPHLAPEDVTAAGGTLPWEIVVLAAGRYPGNPSSRMRADELALAGQFVAAGGTLLLVPQSGWQDSATGESDFFLQNRLLEELGVPVRSERDVLVGEVWVDEPHTWSEAAYPTPLEPSIGYPYLYPPGGEAIAGGNLPTLLVDGEEAEVLLESADAGYLWRGLDGSAEVLRAPRAVAAVAPTGPGFVAVVPRGPLLVTAASGTMSDKPAQDFAVLATTRSWLGDLARYLHALASGSEAFVAEHPRTGDDLFSVSAPGWDPLDPEAEEYRVTSSIQDWALPEALPEGALGEARPSPVADRPLPDWFSPGGGRLGYGSFPSDMETLFAEADRHDLDVVMTSTDPSRLATLTGDELAAEQARYAEVAAQAAAAGVRWYVGDWIATPPGEYPEEVGSHGGGANVVATVDEAFWAEQIIPAFEAVGALAAGHPGLSGLHWDLELYGGPIWHHDGWAFSDDTVEYGIAGFDADLIEDLRSAPARERLDRLVDAGALGPYFAALEARAEDLGRRCREAAHAHDPDLGLMVYAPGFADTWFYTGLMRGLGTVEQPVVLLTYEGWSDTPTDTLYAEGVPLAHLGGTIVAYYQATDFASSLVNLARGNDGYWFFQVTDISAANTNPPELFDPAALYWGGVDTANQVLGAGGGSG